jgi:hypothetical protein
MGYVVTDGTERFSGGMSRAKIPRGTGDFTMASHIPSGALLPDPLLCKKIQDF